MKRVFALRSLTRPQSISIASTSRRVADQTATPNVADRIAAAMRVELVQARAGKRHGSTVDTGAQSGDQRGQRSGLYGDRFNFNIRVLAEIMGFRRRHIMAAQLDNSAPRLRCWRLQNMGAQIGPDIRKAGFCKTVADEKHDIAATARFARRRQHHPDIRA